MKLYGAIDLHSNNNVTMLIDEQDQVVYQKRLPNELEQLSGYCCSVEQFLGYIAAVVGDTLQHCFV
jgi:hypothetical protein